MALVRVKSLTQPQEVKQKVLRDLFWYDPDKKLLLKFKGTRLEFDYRFDTTLAEIGVEPKHRLIPRVVVAEERVAVKTRNINHLMRWFRDYKNYNDSEASLVVQTAKKDTATFEVPDEEIDDFLDNLTRNRFNYELI